MSPRLVLAITLTALPVLAAPGAASAATELELSAELTGEVEVPTGDPDGTGTAELALRADQVCFRLVDVQAVAPINAGHIHRGVPGEAGPVVVPLLTDPAGLPTEELFTSEQACVDADPAVLGDIRADPAAFYVNLHNAEFPQGAIRGQLQGMGELPRTGGAADGVLLGAATVATGGALVLLARRRGDASD